MSGPPKPHIASHADHQLFKVGIANIGWMFDREEAGVRPVINYAGPHTDNPDGTRTIRLRFPLMVVTDVVSDGYKIAERATAILNEYWDTRDVPSVPPAPEVALARVAVLIAQTGGDADRLEFHRGWAAACAAVTAAMNVGIDANNQADFAVIDYGLRTPDGLVSITRVSHRDLPDWLQNELIGKHSEGEL